MTFSKFQSPLRSKTVCGAALLAAAALLLTVGFASPASAQGDESTAVLGGGECPTGTNVEVVVVTTAGEEITTENVAPDQNGDWLATVTLTAMDEAVIASATCFDGDAALVDYSPISLRVQPGVDVSGTITLTAVPRDSADVAEQGDALPNTGPLTMPLAALALALVAGGLAMAYISTERRQAPVAPTKSWPTSTWGK